jgi:hypothetical protein
VAGIDVGSSGGRRRTVNSDLNMVPFIDLLMCTIAFLLITAVWVTGASVQANAEVPGTKQGGDTPPPTRALHVSVREDDFLLQWKEGRTVISEVVVPRLPVEIGGTERIARFPDLGKAIGEQWKQGRVHFDPSDRARDQLVLHSTNETPFRDLIAVMDAANATKRSLRAKDGSLASVPAFSSTFAVQ